MSNLEHHERLQILHVDDDPMNRRVVRDILSAFGHVAFGADSGAAALRQLDASVFDLVLMDIHMPEMDGIEVVRRLRTSAGPGRFTPVIALTANYGSRDHEDYLALGFQDWVTKPILVSRLHAAITKATGVTPREEVRRLRRG